MLKELKTCCLLLFLFGHSACQQGRIGRSHTHASESATPSPQENPLVAMASSPEITDRYQKWSDKGAFFKGQRLTLMTESLKVRVGKPIKVWHVFETQGSDSQIYVTGTKSVPGEYLDGKLQTSLALPGRPYPWQVTHTGAVMHTTGIDTQWEPSYYTFDHPGQYKIQWKIDSLASNVLTVRVK